MISPWENIAHCLREELAECGGLLSLFEKQQGALLSHDASGVLGEVAAIEQQVRTLANRRVSREEAVSAFATAHGQSPTATLRSLLPHVDIEARPLVEALIAEVNRLVYRVRQASRQNHLLLSRTLEINQETLQQLRPDSFSKTYSPAGRVALASPTASTLCHAG
jgi:flagellar biosynthesis/type III secretory pathway chaperone